MDVNLVGNKIFMRTKKNKCKEILKAMTRVYKLADVNALYEELVESGE